MKSNLFKTTFKTVFLWVLLMQLFIIIGSSILILKPFMQKRLEAISTQVIETSQGLRHKNFDIIDALNLDDYQESWLPFNILLADQIEYSNIGSLVTVYYQPNNPNVYFVYLKLNNRQFLISYPHKLIGTQPALTFFSFIALLFLSSFFVAWVIAQKQRKVYQQLANQAQQIGRGDFELEANEFDIIEIQQLFDSIKTMSLSILKAQQDKVVLLAGISHDLRTPITRLYLQLAINEQKIPAELLHSLEEELKQIETMIELFIDQSQLEYQSNERLESIELSQWLKGLIAKYNQPRLSLITSKTMSLNVNAIVLERILQNVIDNALKYTEGQVELSFTQADSICQIAVKDFGNGMSQQGMTQAQNTLLQPFMQGDSKTNGFGLGLSIVQYLAEQQGWRVIYQHSPKQGTIVRLEIPLSPDMKG